MWRSVGAVVGGYVGIVALVMLGTVASVAAFVPGGLAAMSSPAAPADGLPPMFLVANLVAGLVAATVGGWVAARVGSSAPWRHVLALGVLLAGMSVVTAVAPGPAASGQPLWYPWAILAVGLTGVGLGGWLATRRVAAV